MSTKVTHVDEKGRSSKLLVKGAPEVIRDLLSEIPQNYDKAYTFYTSKGLRVLALAHRILDE
jgi:cation-transporting ATPase 13A1